MLPYLDPSFAMLWRAPGVLQVGLDPTRAWALDGAPRVLPGVLRRLTGVASRDEVLADLRGTEHEPPCAAAVDLLEQAGALRHGDPGLRLDQAWVEVVGSGTLATCVGERLAGLVGRVSRADGPSARHPDLVVLAATAGRGLVWAEGAMSRGGAHLWVHLWDGRAVVGPLVQPGRSPCLRCLDLHRTDSDPAWPRLAMAWEQSPVPPPTQKVAAATELAAAVAVGQVLRFLGDEPCASLGGTLEEQPDGTVAVHAWPSHPGCGCGWAEQVPRPAARPTGRASTRAGRRAQGPAPHRGTEERVSAA